MPTILGTPAWLLLAWSGLAATLVSACVRALLPLPPGPGRRTAAHRLARSVILGLLAFPLAYGLAFETIGRADLVSGAALGLLHGLLEAGLRLRNAAPHHRGRPFALGLLGGLSYGLVIGFLYLVPA